MIAILNKYEKKQIVKQFANFSQVFENQIYIFLMKMFEHIEIYFSMLNICNIDITAEFNEIIKAFKSKTNQNVILKSIIFILQNKINHSKNENICLKSSVSNEIANRMVLFENKNAHLNHQIQFISNEIAN